MPRFFIIISAVLLLSTCKPKSEEITPDPNVQLVFSTDSVKFDAVFTSFKSVTKRLKVINTSENAVIISSIALKSENSPFSLIIDGQEENSAENVQLLGQDSLIILASITIEPTADTDPFLVEDVLRFVTNGNEQEVVYTAYGQNANVIPGGDLACNTTWNDPKPYVVTGSVVVPQGCSLTLPAGTRVHTKEGVFFTVKGTLVVQGTLADPVSFSGFRLEEKFENAADQWGGIIFEPGSQNNSIDFATIKNAKAGIFLNTPDGDVVNDLVLSNSFIKNMSGSGVTAVQSDMYAFNNVITNCADRLVDVSAGNYVFYHNTLANFNFDFLHSLPSLRIADKGFVNDVEVVDDVTAEFKNNSVWGSLSEEAELDNSGGALFTLTHEFNLFRTDLAELNGNNNLIDQDPKFENAGKFDLRVKIGSPAVDAGLVIALPELTFDITGTLRDGSPDIGAYELVP